LGVSRFIFYAAERSQPWNMVGRLQRLGQVALAAIEQAEIGRVPDLETAGSLSDALSHLGKVQTVLALSPRSSLTMAALMQRGSLALGGAVAAAVGPEGGFTAHEEDLLRADGAVSIRLSTGILRSELAGFAAGLIVRELQSMQ
jgi:16S rRNA (uracil1498-N3)-methyltransferase